MSRKVTAVEWLIEKLQKNEDISKESPYVNSLLRLAKAMEKQQIADAYDYEANADMHDYSSGEQYYDQTFL